MSTTQTDPVAAAASEQLTAVRGDIERVQAELGGEIARLQSQLAESLAPLRERQTKLERVLSTLTGEQSRRRGRTRGRPRSQGGDVREAALAAVRDAGEEGATGAAVTSATGRSANAVRAHLRALADEGLLVRGEDNRYRAASVAA